MMCPERCLRITGKTARVYATSDWSLQELTEWLYGQGLRSRGDRRNPKGVRVVLGRVHHLLRNPFYYGMMRYKGATSTTGARNPTAPSPAANPTCGRRNSPDSSPSSSRVSSSMMMSTPSWRDILKQSHADEQRYRDEQLERLHRLKADLQKKEDSLLERLLDETVTREVYEAKFTVLEQERGKLDAAILGHEQANRSHFELMEKFLEAARSVYKLFIAGDLAHKRELIQNVASNGVLLDKKVRLNLKRGPAVLAERPKLASGAPSGIRTRVTGLKGRRPRPG